MEAKVSAFKEAYFHIMQRDESKRLIGYKRLWKLLPELSDSYETIEVITVSSQKILHICLSDCCLNNPNLILKSLRILVFFSHYPTFVHLWNESTVSKTICLYSDLIKKNISSEVSFYSIWAIRSQNFDSSFLSSQVSLLLECIFTSLKNPWKLFTICEIAYYALLVLVEKCSKKMHELSSLWFFEIFDFLFQNEKRIKKLSLILLDSSESILIPPNPLLSNTLYDKLKQSYLKILKLKFKNDDNIYFFLQIWTWILRLLPLPLFLSDDSLRTDLLYCIHTSLSSKNVKNQNYAHMKWRFFVDSFIAYTCEKNIAPTNNELSILLNPLIFTLESNDSCHLLNDSCFDTWHCIIRGFSQFIHVSSIFDQTIIQMLSIFIKTCQNQSLQDLNSNLNLIRKCIEEVDNILIMWLDELNEQGDDDGDEIHFRNEDGILSARGHLLGEGDLVKEKNGKRDMPEKRKKEDQEEKKQKEEKEEKEEKEDWNKEESENTMKIEKKQTEEKNIEIQKGDVGNDRLSSSFDKRERQNQILSSLEGNLRTLLSLSFSFLPFIFQQFSNSSMDSKIKKCMTTSISQTRDHSFALNLNVELIKEEESKTFLYLPFHHLWISMIKIANAIFFTHPSFPWKDILSFIIHANEILYDDFVLVGGRNSRKLHALYALELLMIVMDEIPSSLLLSSFSTIDDKERKELTQQNAAVGWSERVEDGIEEVIGKNNGRDINEMEGIEERIVNKDEDEEVKGKLVNRKKRKFDLTKEEYEVHESILFPKKEGKSHAYTNGDEIPCSKDGDDEKIVRESIVNERRKENSFIDHDSSVEAERFIKNGLKKKKIIQKHIIPSLSLVISFIKIHQILVFESEKYIDVIENVIPKMNSFFSLLEKSDEEWEILSHFLYLFCNCSKKIFVSLPNYTMDDVKAMNNIKDLNLDTSDSSLKKGKHPYHPHHSPPPPQQQQQQQQKQVKKQKQKQQYELFQHVWNVISSHFCDRIQSLTREKEEMEKRKNYFQKSELHFFLTTSSQILLFPLQLSLTFPYDFDSELTLQMQRDTKNQIQKVLQLTLSSFVNDRNEKVYFFKSLSEFTFVSFFRFYFCNDNERIANSNNVPSLHLSHSFIPTLFILLHEIIEALEKDVRLKMTTAVNHSHHFKPIFDHSSCFRTNPCQEGENSHWKKTMSYLCCSQSFKKMLFNFLKNNGVQEDGRKMEIEKDDDLVKKRHSNGRMEREKVGDLHKKGYRNIESEGDDDLYKENYGYRKGEREKGDDHDDNEKEGYNHCKKENKEKYSRMCTSLDIPSMNCEMIMKVWIHSNMYVSYADKVVDLPIDKFEIFLLLSLVMRCILLAPLHLEKFIRDSVLKTLTLTFSMLKDLIDSNRCSNVAEMQIDLLLPCFLQWLNWKFQSSEWKPTEPASKPFSKPNSKPPSKPQKYSNQNESKSAANCKAENHVFEINNPNNKSKSEANLNTKQKSNSNSNSISSSHSSPTSISNPNTRKRIVCEFFSSLNACFQSFLHSLCESKPSSSQLNQKWKEMLFPVFSLADHHEHEEIFNSTRLWKLILGDEMHSGSRNSTKIKKSYEKYEDSGDESLRRSIPDHEAIVTKPIRLKIKEAEMNTKHEPSEPQSKLKSAIPDVKLLSSTPPDACFEVGPELRVLGLGTDLQTVPEPVSDYALTQIWSKPDSVPTPRVDIHKWNKTSENAPHFQRKKSPARTMDAILHDGSFNVSHVLQVILERNKTESNELNERLKSKLREFQRKFVEHEQQKKKNI